jgi:large subunit ribosomal protein L24
MATNQKKSVKLRIKKGDTVLLLSGEDKGKKGEVLEVFPDRYRAIVKDINMVKKHVKPTAEKPGGIVPQEAAVHISKLMLVDAEGIASRVKIEVRDGKKVRVSKKTKAVIADPYVKKQPEA